MTELIEFKEHKRTIFFEERRTTTTFPTEIRFENILHSFFLKIPNGVQIIDYLNADTFIGMPTAYHFQGLRVAFSKERQSDDYYTACLGNAGTCGTICLGGGESFYYARYNSLQELTNEITNLYWKSPFNNSNPMFLYNEKILHFLEEWAIVTKNNEDVYTFLHEYRKKYDFPLPYYKLSEIMD